MARYFRVFVSQCKKAQYIMKLDDDQDENDAHENWHEEYPGNRIDEPWKDDYETLDVYDVEELDEDEVEDEERTRERIANRYAQQAIELQDFDIDSLEEWVHHSDQDTWRDRYIEIGQDILKLIAEIRQLRNNLEGAEAAYDGAVDDARKYIERFGNG